MAECEQTKGMSVLSHGMSVNAYYQDLLSHLKDGTALTHDWRLPDWLNEAVLPYLYSDDVMSRYQVYHDCGKPFCRCIDDEGRVHFPNHAEISYETAKQYGFQDMVCDLIRHDMAIHTVKDAGLPDFLALGDKMAISLLITGLCEIHSNASMFGGIESVSFKQKWKQINKRGKKVIAKLVS